MSGRRLFRVQADAYGVHLEVRVEHSVNATPQELDRALTLAAAQARAAHAGPATPTSPAADTTDPTEGTSTP